MGLITKEVEIKWNLNTKQMYESKGYIFTKYRDTFLVSVHDLSFGSNEEIDVECDGCKKVFPLKFCFYNKYAHSDGSYYCHKCSHNGNKKYLSFAEWGIREFGDDFLDKYWDYELNEFNPYDITKCYNGYIFIKCQEKDYHGSYKITANDFYNGYRCGYCGNIQTHYKDSLGYLYPEILNIWSDKNDESSPYEYALQSSKNAWWKCENGIHEDYERKIQNSNSYNFRCPSCVQERNESFLQEKVRIYLESFGVNVCHENNCSLKPNNIIKHKSLKSGFVLKYDNEIIFDNARIFIEVHGFQHYEISYFHKLQAKRNNTTPKYELEYIQKKDAFKKQYVLDNGYDYLEIPYWTDDENETWKSLIDDKINDVLNRL